MADERSVGELLDELFGFESVAKRQTALEQYDRGELVRKARSRELLDVLRGVEAAERCWGGLAAWVRVRSSAQPRLPGESVG